LVEPIAFAVHFQDIDVMGQPAEQGPGQAFGSEGLCPFLEKQFCAGLAVGNEAQFIDDQQLDLSQFRRESHRRNC